MLIGAIDLEATEAAAPVLSAYHALGQWLVDKPRTTRLPAEDLPLEVITPSWAPHVHNSDDATVNRAAYACRRDVDDFGRGATTCTCRPDHLLLSSVAGVARPAPCDLHHHPREPHDGHAERATARKATEQQSVAIADITDNYRITVSGAPSRT